MKTVGTYECSDSQDDRSGTIHCVYRRTLVGRSWVAEFKDERMARGFCKLLNSTWRKWCYDPALSKEEE